MKQRKQAKEDWSGCGDRFYRRIRPSGLLGRTGPGRRPGTILNELPSMQNLWSNLSYLGQRCWAPGSCGIWWLMPS
ncbi:hypothetical protein NicSoilE8_42870 (plasmid) [Arthrobacter sp. NicSoilE8]|nr:hypothetical protein NicSoilE8_42870 [Arthrobacter sp. NicSoilE8]